MLFLPLHKQRLNLPTAAMASQHTRELSHQWRSGHKEDRLTAFAQLSYSTKVGYFGTAGIDCVTGAYLAQVLECNNEISNKITWIIRSGSVSWNVLARRVA